MFKAGNSGNMMFKAFSVNLEPSFMLAEKKLFIWAYRERRNPSIGGMMKTNLLSPNRTQVSLA